MKKNVETISEKLNLDSWELKNVDGDDISDVLKKVEKSFDIRFDDNELNDVKTFGELCDIITAKVQGEDRDDCSSQQAFYKLREAFAKATLVDKTGIKPNTSLRELFPKPNRKKMLKQAEGQLGFKLNLLQPNGWLSAALHLVVLASIVYFFIDWKLGLGGLLFFILANHLAHKTANEIGMQTVSELVARLTKENYCKVRRYPATINRKEMTEQVKLFFVEELSLEPSALHREATFI